ncbi:hypothetical protein RIF29_07598 [Crotalaria pallida]|uniref:Uncharacterized protein n=1 Tax=Crotalaria pallida TaxID=3830 RepID=A0AAN9PBG4_CROPI
MTALLTAAAMARVGSRADINLHIWHNTLKLLRLCECSAKLESDPEIRQLDGSHDSMNELLLKRFYCFYTQLADSTSRANE